MTRMETFAVQDMPQPFLDLAWRVFFASRGRGVSLYAHFPWLRGGGRNDRAWCLTDDAARPAAMLVAREGLVRDAEGPTRFHAIGLVCTAPEQERRGYASRLIEAVLDDIGPEVPVMLWTSQHAFYARFGFASIDPTIVVDCDLTALPTVGGAIDEGAWESGRSDLFGGEVGLPTFVEGVRRFQAAGSATPLLLSMTPRPTIIHMDARAADAARAIADLGIDRLLVNLPRDGSLIQELERSGVAVNVRPTNIAMWCPGRCDPDRIARWEIGLIERF